MEGMVPERGQGWFIPTINSEQFDDTEADFICSLLSRNACEDCESPSFSFVSLPRLTIWSGLNIWLSTATLISVQAALIVLYLDTVMLLMLYPTTPPNIKERTINNAFLPLLINPLLTTKNAIHIVRDKKPEATSNPGNYHISTTLPSPSLSIVNSIIPVIKVLNTTEKESVYSMAYNSHIN